MKEENGHENVMESKYTKENKIEHKKNSKIGRINLVLFFLIVFVIVSYIGLRGSYLEYLELGEKYTSVFFTNITYKYSIMAINFVLLYFIIYLTNRGIKKGLKPFFQSENKEMPKLLNKSLALIISAIVSIIVSTIFMQKLMICTNGTAFGIQDVVFNIDISYYMFQRPIIEMLLIYFVALIVGLSLYMALYYVIVFNIFFDGIDGKMLKEGMLLKKIFRNLILISIGIALLTVLNTQNILFGKMLTIGNNIEIVGAGTTETTINLWGYIIFALIIVIYVYRAIKNFEKGNTNKVLKNLAVIPAYLIVLFILMISFDIIFVNSNELDAEKMNIAENIKNTKNAYNIDIEETNIGNSGTITAEEANESEKVINNIPIISQDAVLKTLKDSQTETGYFSYRNANLAEYEINGNNMLIYLAPREISNANRTYNNKTYELTHGMGVIMASATNSTETGNVKYIQKEIDGKDEKIDIFEPRIYFGMETKQIIATNTKNKKEYDYTDENGKEYTSTYNGKAGLKLGLIDRLILGITKGDLNLAFSNEINNESKILINRDILTRAKKAMPYLIYDKNPYTVISENGRLIWVVDGYTVSSNYPYSQYSNIEHDGVRENINYIRNSVKVLIDSYDGTVSYYITDRTDPIIMAYRNIYPEIFVDLDVKIPEDIEKHFVYPEFLYNVQADILKIYHNVKTDVLYRADDIWDISKYNNANLNKSTGTYMNSYYTMLKTVDGEKFGLVQIYTPNEKQNIISYLVGTNEKSQNKLKLYKFSADSNIVGPMQLDKQISEDEAISKELENLNITGTKLTKRMLIVPINNTLLYVEPIYQTMLNESDIPVLKKIIIASGNKVAIGDSVNKALENLLSKYAVDIEIENTDNLEGLIESIIKANNNLTNSSNSQDWEMMGKDIKKLQDLIKSLEELKGEEEKNKNNVEKIEDNDKTEI